MQQSSQPVVDKHAAQVDKLVEKKGRKRIVTEP